MPAAVLPRMLRPVRRLLLIVALAWPAGAFGLEPLAALQGPYALDHIVDGDTIRVVIEGRPTPVRLIGIDTPETKAPGGAVQPFGPEAADHLGRMLRGRPLWLELDVQPRDRYERLLAYVYFEDPAGSWTWNGARFAQANLRMALSGFADVLTIPPDVRYAELYRYAVRTAREAQRGMWGAPPPPAPGVAGEGDGAGATGAPAVRIACVRFDPQGSDAGNETVTLQVLRDVDTSGWRLEDAAGHVLSLPRQRFAAGAVVEVRNHSDPIWNNSGGDTASLFDASGTRVDAFEYAGGGTEACR